MSELADVQHAVGVILRDAEAAFRRDEISLDLMLGIRLYLTAAAMKSAYQPGAMKIVRTWAETVGVDFDVLEGQMRARIYQEAQIRRMESK